MEYLFEIPRRLEDLDLAKTIEFIDQRIECGCPACTLAATVLLVELMRLDMKTKAEVRAKAGMN